MQISQNIKSNLPNSQEQEPCLRPQIVSNRVLISENRDLRETTFFRDDKINDFYFYKSDSVFFILSTLVFQFFFKGLST